MSDSGTTEGIGRRTMNRPLNEIPVSITGEIAVALIDLSGGHFDPDLPHLIFQESQGDQFVLDDPNFSECLVK